MIAFVPLAPQHLPLMLGWYGEPHLHWWREGRTWSAADIEAEYGPLARGEDRDGVGFVIELAGAPIGYIQRYAVARSLPAGVSGPGNPLFATRALATMAGLDLFIGEPTALGHGHGIATIRTFLAREVFPRFASVVVDPRADNARAIRAFARSGFVRTPHGEDPAYVVMVQDRPDPEL